MINMTIVVAVKTDDKIIIGSDKRVIEDETITSENSSKILIKDFAIESYSDLKYDKFIIAFSGLYSLFELLRTFKAPNMNSKDSFLEYLYKTFVPKLNSHLNKYNFIQEYRSGQRGVDWELIIAYKNSLFLVEFNLGISEIQTPYYAIGAPRDIALGSLYTSYNETKHPVEIRMVKTAIHACATHNTTCNDNIDLYSIKKTGEIKQI